MKGQGESPFLPTLTQGDNDMKWNKLKQYQTQQFDVEIWYVFQKPRRYFITVNGLLPVKKQQYIDKYGIENNILPRLTKSEAEKEALGLIEKIEKFSAYQYNFKRGGDWNTKQKNEIKIFEEWWGISILPKF